MNNMLRLSTPTALERMALSLAQIVMTSVVAGMGTVAVASNYVAVQTESICYLPAFGVTGVWISMTAELITRGVVFLIRLLRGRWLKMPVLF